MNKPLVFLLLILICVAQTPQAKAQLAKASTGDLGATTAAGNAYWVAAQLALQRGESEAAFISSDRACQAGTGIACAVAGEMIVQGQTVMGTPEQSVALFQKGCDLGNANACQGLGLMLVQGIGGAADTQKGLSVMQKSCQAGNAMACVNLGRMFEMGLFSSPRRAEAKLYFDRALALQADNELAIQAHKENGYPVRTDPASSSPSLPSTASIRPMELRGRLANNPGVDPTSAVQTPQTTCWASAATKWNSLRGSTPAKPTWNTAAAGRTLATADAQTMGLLMLVASKPIAALPADDQKLATCEVQFEESLKRLLRQTWAVTPDALAQNTLIQVIPPLDLVSHETTSEQTLLLIFDIKVGTQRRPLHADRGFALYRVNCEAGEAMLSFYFQTDHQGKLPLAWSSAKATPPVAISERTQRLGCAPQSERRLWTQLSGLEAALSLQFEQDQQQTP